MKVDKKNWSSFWMDDAFDIEFKSKETNTVDYTKLAATQRAIANFVNIVTGKQIPVKFQGNASYTDGQTVTIGTKLDGVNFDPAVGLALHEGSHIAFTDFDMLKSNTYRLKDSKLAAIAIMHDSANVDLLENDYMVIKDLLNWIEDRRIDLLIYKTAPGYRVYYEAMYDKYFNDKVIDDALQKRIKNQETVDDYLFHVINFTNPNRDLATLSKLTDIWNLINLKDIQRLKSTSDSALLAIQVYKVIKTAVGEAKSQTEEQTEAPANKIPGSGSESGDESGDGMESAEGESVSSNDDTGSDLNGDAEEPSSNIAEAVGYLTIIIPDPPFPP